MFMLRLKETGVTDDKTEEKKKTDDKADSPEPCAASVRSVEDYKFPKLVANTDVGPLPMHCDDHMTTSTCTLSSPSPDTGPLSQTPSPPSSAQNDYISSPSSSMACTVSSKLKPVSSKDQAVPTQGLLYNLLMNSDKLISEQYSRSKLLISEADSVYFMSKLKLTTESSPTEEEAESSPHIDLTMSSPTAMSEAETTSCNSLSSIHTTNSCNSNSTVTGVDSNMKSTMNPNLQVDIVVQPAHQGQFKNPMKLQTQSHPFAEDLALYLSQLPSTSHTNYGCPRVQILPSSRSSLTSTDSGMDEPVDLSCNPFLVHILNEKPDTKFSKPNNGMNASNQIVQLAKKTAGPVQARVTEIIRQTTIFVASTCPLLEIIKKPSRFSACSWLENFSQCWHKLLAVGMAEISLEIVAVERTASIQSSTDNCHSLVPPSEQTNLPWSVLGSFEKMISGLPDREFSNLLTSFLEDMQQANLTTDDYHLIRAIILISNNEPLSVYSLAMKLYRGDLDLDVILLNNQEPASEAVRVPTADEMFHIERGLLALGKLDPYKMANLLCTHLLHSPTSSTCAVGRMFLWELNQQYLVMSAQLSGVSLHTNGFSSTTEMMDVVVEEDEEENNVSNMDNTDTEAPMSIFEQIFDSS